MKASEYIKRIQSLMEVAGDVEVIIEDNRFNGYYQIANCELQTCVKTKPLNIGDGYLKYTDNHMDRDKDLSEEEALEIMGEWDKYDNVLLYF